MRWSFETTKVEAVAYGRHMPNVDSVVLRMVMIRSRDAMSGSVFGFRKVTLPFSGDAELSRTG